MAPERHELIWVATGQVLTLVVGFLSIKILTHLMDSAMYGQLMLGVSLAALVSLFIYGPLGQAATRFYSVYRERGDLATYVCAFRNIHSRLLWLLIAPTCSAAVVFSFFVAGGIWPWLVATAVLYSAVAGLNHGFLSMFSAMRRRVVVAVHQSGESAARLIGAVIAMSVAGISPGVALIGYASGSLLILVSLYTVARMTGGLERDRTPCPSLETAASAARANSVYTEIWQYVLPFFVWAAIGYAFMHGDRWVLQSVSGPEAVGTYMAIYQIGSALPNAMISVISQYIEPLVFERFETSRTSRNKTDGTSLIGKSVLYTGLILIAMVAIASGWSMAIVGFVTTAEIAQHSRLLAWIVAGTGLIGLGQILTIYGLAMRRPSAYISSKTVAAIALLCAACYGATQRGAEGVAMALVAAGVLYLGSVLYVNARLARVESA